MCSLMIYSFRASFSCLSHGPHAPYWYHILAKGSALDSQLITAVAILTFIMRELDSNPISMQFSADMLLILSHKLPATWGTSQTYQHQAAPISPCGRNETVNNLSESLTNCIAWSPMLTKTRRSAIGGDCPVSLDSSRWPRVRFPGLASTLGTIRGRDPPRTDFVGVL